MLPVSVVRIGDMKREMKRQIGECFGKNTGD